MWDHTDGCANHYHFESSIYLLYCLYLGFNIIIYIAVGSPRHDKDVFGGINDRDRRNRNDRAIKALINLILPQDKLSS